MYTKLIKHNSTINTVQFLNSIQSNLNVEPSFVGIHQVLREIWLFEHEFNFKSEILANFEFLGVLNLLTDCFIKDSVLLYLFLLV